MSFMRYLKSLPVPLAASLLTGTAAAALATKAPDNTTERRVRLRMERALRGMA
jgi:hypothetical protein